MMLTFMLLILNLSVIFSVENSSTIKHKENSTATIYILTPNQQLKWNSPSELASSSLSNGALATHFGLRFIDHMILELNCNTNIKKQNQPFYFAFTLNDTQKVLQDVYKNGEGFNILFNKYNGEFESQESLFQMIKQSKEKKEKNLYFVQFQLLNESCNNLANNAKKLYLDNDIKYSLHYHHNDKSTNCTQFILDLFEAEKLISPINKNKLVTQLFVPTELMKTLDKPVLPQNIYLSKYGNIEWSSPMANTETKTFKLYNPEILTKNIKKLADGTKQGIILKGSFDDFLSSI